MCVTICCAAYITYGAEIGGVIVDKDNKPVAGESIYLIPDAGDRLLQDAGIEATTTPTGEFMFSDVDVGTYLLRRLERGYPAQVVVVQTNSDNISDLFIKQRMNTHALFVQVVQPLAESKIVRLFPGTATPMSDFNHYGNADTNAPTTYSFTNLYEGAYVLTIENSAEIKNICDVFISDDVQSFGITNSSDRISPFEVKLWQDDQSASSVTWKHIME